MTDHKGLPVTGYVDQSQRNVDAVNQNKILEERVLRRIEELFAVTEEVTIDGAHDFHPAHVFSYDQRWLHLAKTHIQQGFMAMNRAVFQPARVKLPEDV